MYLNQVSIKDLFTTNISQISKDDQNDSALDHCSQFPYSQFEGDSLDFGSQSQSQPLVSSLSQHSQSPNKRSVPKYGSKIQYGSQISKNAPNANFGKTNFGIQTKTRPKEEYRDFHPIANAVKECRSEVRDAITNIKSNLEHRVGQIDTNLEHSVQKLEDVQTKRHEIMIKALVEREKVNQKINDLEKDLVKKDSRIDELEKQVEETKNLQNENFLQTLQSGYKSGADEMRKSVKQTLDEFLKCLSSNQESQKLLTREISIALKNDQKEFKDQFVQTLDTFMIRLHFEIINELEKLKDHQEEKLEETGKRLIDMHSQQEEEIKGMLYQQIQTLCQKNCETKHEVVGKITERLQEIVRQQRQDLIKSICSDIKCINQEQHKTHESMLHHFIHSKQNQFRNVQLEQYDNIELAIQNGIEKGLKDFFTAQELEITTKGADKCIKMSELDSPKLCLPSSLKRSFRNYPDKSLNLELKNNLGEDNKRSKTGTLALQQGSSHFMSPPFSVSKPFRNKMWGCKINPSPVAAIVPRVKGSIFNGNDECISQDTFLARPLLTVPSKANGPKGRTYSNKKTYNKHNYKDSASVGHETYSSDNCDDYFTANRLRKRVQTHQTPIANFEQISTLRSKDETLTASFVKSKPCIKEVEDNFSIKGQLQLVTSGNSDSEEAEDDDSQKSSPAMAVMEVIIKRKVQERRNPRGTKSFTPYRKSRYQLGNDFLSSPNFCSDSLQETRKQDINDENSSFVTTEVVDIRQYIKRQPKSRKR